MSALSWLIDRVFRRGGFYVLSIRHDDGCRSLRSQSGDDCRCARTTTELRDFTGQREAAAQFLADEDGGSR